MTRVNFLPIFLTWMSLAPALAADDGGGIRGRVLDPTGAPLAGVAIDLVIGTRERTVVTDDRGQYRFDNLPPGRAELTLRLLNFATVRRAVDVPADRSVTADVVMTLSLTADVIVTTRSTFRNIADAVNPAENLIGIASAASQGAVTAEQLEVRPVMRVGEVLETVPGMIVSQHSGEGKANQYYLRGFNLDHGTDFAVTVAGVPVNMPSGAHAHGYADANFLIPELVSGVQFRKGPYFADEGDFSAAGAANVSYLTDLERPLVHVSGGNDGWARLFGAASPRVGAGHLLAAIDLSHNDGPWERPDDYRRLNGVARYSRGDHRDGFSATAMGSWARWDATDQVPARAIARGMISRFGLLDPTDRGSTSRQSGAAEFQRSRGPSAWRATGFLLSNRLDLLSNFTYFLDDPVNGDQFAQTERRTAAGGRLTYRRLGHLFERHAESAIGLQIRRDWIDPVGLHRTVAGRRLSTVRDDEIGQTMISGYAQSEVEWLRALRATIGLRVDNYRFSVASNDPANSGAGSDALVSPKLGVVLGPWQATEVYANAGMGFHSNDARGAVIRHDPVTRDAVDPVTPLVRARGAELGLRTVRVRGVQSTFALWYLGLDSELVFVGDAGTTEVGRPSRRFGVEWASYARVRPWLTIDWDISFSRARFAGDDAGGPSVPGALARVVSAGVAIEPERRVFGSLRLRHLGPRPLVEDASVTSESTTLLNGELGYRLSNNARIVLEAFNLLDTKASDIDYFYRSRLGGEPAEGVADIHTHPAIPRSARVGLQLSF